MPEALREVPQDAVDLIKSFEGIPDGDPSTVNLDAYLDPLDIWTIGWGHAVQHEGKHLKGSQNRALARQLFPGGITREQAEALLRADLLDRSPSVLRLVRAALTDGQFGALMSFVFNVGAGNLAASTLLKLLNAGNLAGAADQFLVWNKGRKNGVLVELAGLTRRRRAERALFLGEDWRAASAERGAPPAARGAKAAPARPAPEMPVRPSAAVQLAAARVSGGRGLPAKSKGKGTGKPPARKSASAPTTKAARSAAKPPAKAGRKKATTSARAKPAARKAAAKKR